MCREEKNGKRLRKLERKNSKRTEKKFKTLKMKKR